ncbi:MAG: hypothetical protein NC420_14920 [Eubacterium sp.]|nr:hypothetical protein [Eubacterium sp.]MCM1239785.1 hypothetical protein [Lachnospiraceae bacterium]
MREADKYSEELSERERQIVMSIRNAPVPDVPREEVEAVCKRAVSYYAESQGIRDAGFWKAAFSCSTTGAAFFWLLAAFLLGSFAVVSLLGAGDEAMTFSFMTAVSPAPILAYVIRELQYRDENLVLLEKTCKYAPARIYFVRLWAGMFVNALFVLLAGLAAFPHYGKLLELYFCAFTAMFFLGAAALFCMAFSDNALPLSLMMAAWILGASYLLRQEEVLEFILNAGTGALAAGALLGFALFTAAATGSTVRMYAEC